MLASNGLPALPAARFRITSAMIACESISAAGVSSDADGVLTDEVDDLESIGLEGITLRPQNRHKIASG